MILKLNYTHNEAESIFYIQFFNEQRNWQYLKGTRLEVGFLTLSSDIFCTTPPSCGWHLSKQTKNKVETTVLLGEILQGYWLQYKTIF